MKIFIYFIVTFLLCSFSSAKEGLFNLEERQEIENIIHNYLITNPKILIKMNQALAQERILEIQKIGAKIAQKNRKELFTAGNSPIIGNPEGNVTIVKFSDYYCIHCRELNLVIEKLIKGNSNLRVIEKQLPIMGELSIFATKIALAASKQNKYFAINHLLMTTPRKQIVSEKQILDIARKIGLDLNKLKKDMEDYAIQKEIENNYKLGKKLMQNQPLATPIIIVGETHGDIKNPLAFYPGAVSFEIMQKTIAAFDKENKAEKKDLQKKSNYSKSITIDIDK